VGLRIYILVAMGVQDTPPASDVKCFFDSFQITE
jgi:hypothetical protein